MTEKVFASFCLRRLLFFVVGVMFGGFDFQKTFCSLSLKKCMTQGGVREQEAECGGLHIDYIDWSNFLI